MATRKHTDILSLLAGYIVYILYNFSIMKDPAVSMVLQELRDIIDNRLGSFIDAEQAIGLMEVKDEKFFNHIKERISTARDLDNLVNVILSNLYLLSFKH